MGVILYLVIGLIAWFLAFYHDYKEVANAPWCDDPVKWANQFAVFHMMAAIFWPLVLFILFLLGVSLVIGWVCRVTIGQVFGKVAAWLNKRGV